MKSDFTHHLQAALAQLEAEGLTKRERVLTILGWGNA